MKFKILAMLAALVLVSACESQQANTTGGPTNVPGPGVGSKEDFAKNVGDRVFFDYDAYQLRPEARTQLDKQAAWLKQYGSYRIVIEGHCDPEASHEIAEVHCPIEQSAGIGCRLAAWHLFR